MFGLKKENAYPLVGLLAALFIIPVVELLLQFKGMFPSNSLFLLVSGACIGGIFSVFFGIMEGLSLGDLNITLKKGAFGLIIGAFGGMLGIMTAQLLLGIVQSRFYQLDAVQHEILIRLTRLVSWSIMGLFVGISEGIRRFRIKNVLISALGGLTGGLVGGLSTFILADVFPDIVLRCIVFILVGGAIGLFITLIKGRFVHYEIVFLNGPLFEKVFPIMTNSVVIGRIDACDIKIPFYRGVSRKHAQLVRGADNSIMIEDLGSTNGTLVNDSKVTKTKLSSGDFLTIGDARMMIRRKA